MSKFCFTFSLLLFFPLFVNSQIQNIKFEHITERDGLSHSCISCIMQDSKGFIWIGTENGLNKYDGYSMKEFIHEPGNPNSLSSNFIRALYQDPADSGKVLWIGTRGGGLNRFDLELEKFKAYQHNPKDSTSISHNDVQCIYKDRAGTFWIGTEGGGLNEFDRETEKFLSYKHDPNNSNSISNDFIFAICEDKLGYLWIGNARYGALNRFDRQSKKFSHYNHNLNDPYSLPSDGIYAIHEDNYGELWIGTFLGLCKYDRNNDRFVRPQFNGVYSNVLNNNTIWSTFEDVNNELWIATLNLGLVKINSRRDQFITFQNEPENLSSLCTNDISSICVDRSGIVWAGTYCYGVNKLIPIRKKFSFYQNSLYDSTTLSNNRITSICEDRDSILWIGTVNGLNKFNQNDETFSRYQFVPHTGIAKIVSTNSGDLWIAREFCLTKFIPDKRQLTNFDGRNLTFASDTGFVVKNNQEADLIFERGINHVFIDKSENIWCIIGRISSEGRLYRFDTLKKKFVKFDFFNEQLNQTGVNVIFQDRSGNYWIGMADGSLIKYMNSPPDSSNRKIRQFIQYRISQDDFFNLSETVINVIWEDESGVLWLGSNKGLHKFIPQLGSFKHYNKKDGLASNLILGILEDDNANLWISTDKGLIKFNSKTEQFRNFDESDGLHSIVFNTSASCKSSTGKMYFGGEDGLIAFYPDSLKDNPHIPPVVITDFQLFNQSVAPGIESPLEKSISHTKKIVLNHDQDLISFRFAALDFTEPQKNQYAYKMEGVNQDWVYTDASHRYVTYTKLTPGKYTFRVKGSNNDDIWNEQGTSIQIVITPPWWRTIWAYFLYTFGAMGIITLVWRFQVRRINLNNRLKMKEFEAQKLQEIDSMKSRFFANISHEFRTPLTLILGPLNKMLAQTKNKEKRQEISLMQRNARRLQRLINQLLDLSKIEAGKMTLQARPENIVALLNRIVQSFESQAKLKGIELKFQSEQDEIIAFIDWDKIENVFYNLLSNALKFTPGGGVVRVSINIPPDPIAVRLRG